MAGLAGWFGWLEIWPGNQLGGAGGTQGRGGQMQACLFRPTNINTLFLFFYQNPILPNENPVFSKANAVFSTENTVFSKANAVFSTENHVFSFFSDFSIFFWIFPFFFLIFPKMLDFSYISLILLIFR